MDVMRLVAINREKENVLFVPIPVVLSVQPPKSLQQHQADAVVFFGCPFKVIPDLQQDAYIAKVNECLEYLRVCYPNKRLQYKPHPAETDEYTRLNLKDFRIIQEKNIADTYLQEHRQEILAVFSTHSITSMTAHSLGLNAYLFLDLFNGIYRDGLFRWYRDVCFAEMPDSFFVKDLWSAPKPNAHAVGDNTVLIEKIRRLIPPESDGTIWFILQVSPLDAMLATLKITRKTFPNRRIGLLLYRHHRWDKMDFEVVRNLFDEVHVFPRTFYSLRPRKVLQIVRLASAVKRFPVAVNDVFFGFAGCELLENMFISYHPRNLRISFWMRRGFSVHQRTAENAFFKGRRYSFTPATFVYYKAILPVLRLHQVVFLKPVGEDRELYTIHRYMRPMNEVYDFVFYMSS